MPALLTRIETGPNSLGDGVDQRFDRGAVGDVEHAAVAAASRPGARRSPARRLSVVAVPITVAPCAASASAMAAPMPRLAPVTRAISPLSGHAGSCAHALHCAFGKRGVEFGRRAERARVERLVDALDQARPAPCPGRIRRCGWRRARPAPARSRSTAPAGTAGAPARRGSPSTPSCTSASTFCTTGRSGSCQCMPAITSARRLAASRISGVCEGTLTASFTALRTPRSASSASARSTAAAWPPITIWPGRVVVGRHHDFVAGDLRADSCDQRVFGAEHGGHRAGAGGRGVLHQLAAHAHQVGAIVQRQRAGGDQRAVFAQAVAGEHAPAARRRAAATARHTATPAASSAGWVNSVLVELFLRALPATASTGRRRSPREASSKVVADLRMHGRELGKHAERLRALAGKHEGECAECRSSADSANRRARMIRATCSKSSVPRRSTPAARPQ